jgi:acyl-CoA thioesterase I
MQVALDQFRRLDVPVVLVDLQAAPMMDRDKDTPVMQAAIEKAGTRTGVLHFHRQALMNRLVETHTVEMPDLVAKDGLHMTALGHFCTGQLLARQIARASLMRRGENQP